MTTPVANNSTPIKLPTEMLEALKQRAEQEGVEVNQLVETAIAHYLASTAAIVPDKNDATTIGVSNLEDDLDNVPYNLLDAAGDVPISKTQVGDTASWQASSWTATAQARPLSRQEWETIAERWDAVNFAQMSDGHAAAESVAED